MAEQQEAVRAEAQVVGVVALNTSMTNLDNFTRKQITWAAYREVQEACGEVVSGSDDLPGGEDGRQYLGATDASHYSKPCVISLQGSTLALHEGELEVVRVPMHGVLLAVTLPREPCRVLLVLAPEYHSFTLPQDAAASSIALVLTVSSLVTLGRLLDYIYKQNPLAREASFSARSTSPPPRPPRAARRQQSRETSLGDSLHNEEPPALIQKQSLSIQFTVTDTDGSTTPKMIVDSGNVAAPISVSPNSSGHYPLRGQLSVSRAQDCLSGYYDEVPSGPPRKVEEEEST